MATFVAKTIGKRFLNDHGKDVAAGRKKKYGENVDFPYWEYVNYDKKGNPMKKRRKIPYMPKHLTEEEKTLLEKIRRRTRMVDEAFNICGCFRVGWGVIFGIIPIIGDFFDTLLALWILRSVKKLKPGKKVEAKMVSYIVIDFWLGTIPLLGDIADGVFKCNTKNYELLMDVMGDRSNERAELASGTPERITDPSRIMNEKQAHDNPPRSAAAQGGPTVSIPAHPASPQPAKLGKKSYGDVFVEKYSAWRGGERDLERGEAAPPQLPRH